MADKITIDTSQILAMRARFAAEGDVGMLTEVNRGLRAGGDIVANAARGLASWSSRIPGSIRVNTGKASVTISAGGSGAPHAAPYEGIAGNATFRHPVYGHRTVWVTEATRPFLVPGLNNSADQVVAAINTALDATIARL